MSVYPQGCRRCVRPGSRRDLSQLEAVQRCSPRGLLDDPGAAQRVELPGAPEGVGTFKLEANIKMLMYVTTLTTNITRQSWQLYDQRSRPSSRQIGQ